jgi:hypothetical protein
VIVQRVAVEWVVVEPDPVVCVLEPPEVEVLPLEEVDDTEDVEELDSAVDVFEVDVSDALVVEVSEPEVVLVDETGSEVVLVDDTDSEVVEVVSVEDSEVEVVLEVDVLDGVVEVEVVVWPHSPARSGTALGPFPIGTSFDPQSSDCPRLTCLLSQSYTLGRMSAVILLFPMCWKGFGSI